MKRWLALFLVICMLFAFAACDVEDTYSDGTEDKETEGTEQTEGTDPTDPETPSDPEDPDDPGTSDKPEGPLLYKVTDDAGNVAWLFGSIHVGAEYFYPLPEYVTSAYNSADALAVEFDIKAFENDISAQRVIAGKMLYTDGTTVKNYISAELYDEAVTILQENNMLMPYMDIYHVAMWTDTINSVTAEKTGVNYDLGIDLHMLDKAYTDNKTILDIESAEFQFDMLLGFSDELQVILLEQAIAEYYDPDGYKATVEEVMRLWNSGDEAAFYAYLSEEEVFETEEEARLYAEYNKAMLTDRNVGMADFVENALASGDEVFVCVGAAHVIGRGAMVELLCQRGYTVELVEE